MQICFIYIGTITTGNTIHIIPYRNQDCKIAYNKMTPDEMTKYISKLTDFFPYYTDCYINDIHTDGFIKEKSRNLFAQVPAGLCLCQNLGTTAPS